MSLRSRSVVLGLSLLCISSTASAVVIEDFETGSYSAGWTVAAGTVTPAAAHDGSFGVRLDDATWTVFQGPAGVVSEGSLLSAWVRPQGSGRVYLGFGADATGTHSFVGATNTSDIRFQDNPSFNFVELTTSAQSWTIGQWYRLEVEWQFGGSAVGRLFDSDGVSLLNSVSQGGFTRTSGYVALRGFGGDGWDVDTLMVEQPIPEPASLVLLGSGLLGLIARRRRHLS